MCYFAAMSDEIGIRELRQEASVHLRAVADGAEFTITDRGRAIVQMTPIPASPLERLLRSGRARAPRRNLRELPAPEPGPDVSAELAAMRMPSGTEWRTTSTPRHW